MIEQSMFVVVEVFPGGAQVRGVAESLDGAVAIIKRMYTEDSPNLSASFRIEQAPLVKGH